MNIFLPYEHDVVKSVQSLDTKRLNKQAVECYQMLFEAIREKNGIEPRMRHPVYIFYKYNIPFLAYYGSACCREYTYRTDKVHTLEKYFNRYLGSEELPTDFLGEFGVCQPAYTPYYMEGSKTSPRAIRTTQNVSALFQQKLCKKWDADKEKGRPPQWGKRGAPEFYGEGE